MTRAALQRQTPSAATPASGSWLVQRACSCAKGATRSADGGKDEDRIAPKVNLQTKLMVGAPDDPLEREADRVAEQVTAAKGQLTHAATPAIQAYRPAPSSVADAASDAAPASVDRALGSPASPLDTGLRQDMEHRFGHAFANVRVHAGSEAAQSAQELGAHAYTVGRDIVFGAGRYAPNTGTGLRLLAHELTHVVQQGGGTRHASQGGGGVVQRDLATPRPATPPAAQAELTAAQIASAIRFNRARYDAASTRLIQDLVGTKPTGTWVDADIKLIGLMQEQYGYTKNGLVGAEFFRFLDREVRAERLSTRGNANCLLAFRVITAPQVVGPVVAGRRSITETFQVRAQFSNTCGCADYEYRQFIRGHWRRERGGVVTDLGPTFNTLPGGAGLPAAFIEDGNTGSAALNYGHRAQTAERINRYLDASGAVDQVAGCTYESEDTPGGADRVQPGDVFDVDVNFRGEIQRNGRAVRTLHWTAIRGRFPVP